MKTKIIHIFFFLSLISIQSMAQILESHEWEERVILLFASDFENTNLKKQVEILEKKQSDLDDRKLVVYQITPTSFKKNGIPHSDKMSTAEFFQTYKVAKSQFIFILIGLDGGEKMRSNEIISSEKLFGKIDRMPMRQAEMREKND